jgi:hypothetical protein
VSPSATSALALAALAALAAGCGGGGDGDCGPGGAPASGVTVAAGGEGVEFGQFRSSPNNDCTAPGGGPTSLTVQGGQTDPADPARFLVLCLPRPDRIGGDPIALGDEELVQLVDLTATVDGECRVDLDRDRAPAGTVAFGGFCGDGGDAGYSLAFDATVPLLRSCPGDTGDPEPVDGELGGAAAVTAVGG